MYLPRVDFGAYFGVLDRFLGGFNGEYRGLPGGWPACHWVDTPQKLPFAACATVEWQARGRTPALDWGNLAPVGVTRTASSPGRPASLPGCSADPPADPAASSLRRFPAAALPWSAGTRWAARPRTLSRTFVDMSARRPTCRPGDGHDCPPSFGCPGRRYPSAKQATRQEQHTSRKTRPGETRCSSTQPQYLRLASVHIAKRQDLRRRG